jgi:hypothetical protein
MKLICYEISQEAFDMLVRSSKVHEGDEKCAQNFCHKPSRKDVSVDGRIIWNTFGCQTTD